MANEDQQLLEAYTDKPLSDEDFSKAMQQAEGQDDVHIQTDPIEVTAKPPSRDNPEAWLYAEPGQEPAFETTTGEYATDTVRGVGAGVRDAVQESLNTAASLSDKFRQVTHLDANQPDFWKNLAEKNQLPEIADPTTGIGKFVKGTSQFLTGFIPAFRGVRMLGGATKAGTIANRVVNTTVGAGTAGAVADFTVWDPYEERLSNWAKDSGVPGLDNALTEYLATDMNASELENRYKQALEGMFVGKSLEVAMDTLKPILYAARVIKSGKSGVNHTVDEVAPTLDEQGNPLPQETPLPDNVAEFTTRTPAIAQLNEDQAKALTDAYLRGDWEGAGKAISDNINLDYINTEEDVKDFIEGLHTANETVFKKNTKSMDQTTLEAMGLPANAVEEAAAKMNNMEAYALRTRIASVAIATKVSNMAKLLKLAVTPEEQAKVTGELIRNIGKAQAILQIASQVRTGAGRTLQIYKKPLDGAEYLDQISKIVDMHGGYDNVSKIAEMISDLPDADGMIKAIKDFDKPTWGDAVRELFVNGLFTPITLTTNLFSNTITALYSPAERLMGAYVSQTRGSGEIFAGEAGAHMVGYLKAFPEALSTLWNTYRSETPEFAFKNDYAVKPRHAIDAETFGLGGYSSFKDKPLMYTMGQGINLFGTAVRGLGTRALMATDDAFKILNYRAEINAQAYRQARKEGLEPGTPEFKNRLIEVNQEAYKSAPDGDFYGIHLDSKSAAERLTFTEDLGKMGETLVRGIRSNPNTVIFLPFIKTPTNLVKYFVRRTPGMSAFSEQIAKDLEAGGARGDLAIGQVSLGTNLLMTSMALAAAGYVTGDGSTNPDVKKLMLDSGWRPNSITLDGGVPTSFQRFDPASSFLTLGANTHEAVQAYIRAHPDMEDAELEDGILQIMAVPLTAMTKLVSNRTWLSQTSQWVDAMLHPGTEADPTANISKMINKSAASLVTPFSGQLKWANQQAFDNDNIVREADGLMDEIKKKIPGLSDELPPRPSIWGDAATIDQAPLGGIMPVLRASQKSDAVDKELMRLQKTQKGAIFSMPNFIVEGIKLDPTERWNYYQFVSKYVDPYDNKTMWEMVQDQMNSPEYQADTDANKIARVQKIINVRRSVAENLFLQDAATNGDNAQVRKENNMVLYPMKRDLVTKVARQKAFNAIQHDPTLNKKEIQNEFLDSIKSR